MSDRTQIQGSNAEVAEGGLNPEASFANLDAATQNRMTRSAQSGQKQGGGQLLQNVRQQMARAPESKGAVPGRDEYADR